MADEKKNLTDEAVDEVNGGGWFSNLWEKTKSTGKIVKPAAVASAAGQLKKETIAEDMLDEVSGGAGVKDYKLGGAVPEPMTIADLSDSTSTVGMTNFVPGK